MQMMVPRYLEMSIDSLTQQQEKFRSQITQAFGVTPFGSLEEQARRNMEMFERAFTMFTPFGRREEGRSEEHTSELQSRLDLVCRLLLEKKKAQCGARAGGAGRADG